MDIARHAIDTYFRDTTNPMVRHQLDSYSEFLESKIPRFIKASNPIKLLLEDEREIRIFIGGKSGENIRYTAPIDEEGFAILPHKCRLENMTYKIDVRVDVDVEYDYGGEVETKQFDDIKLASLPLLLKSSLCYLRPMTTEQLYEAGECRFELGGYFIVSGQERVLLTQEGLGSNMFYAKKRVEPPSQEEMRTRSEKELKVQMEAATKENKFEYICGIYSESEDGTVVSNHMLKIPPTNKIVNDSATVSKTNDYSQFSTNRLVTINLAGFDNPIPVISVFYALGFTTDQDIYDVILAGVSTNERTLYDTLFAELILSHEKYLSAELLKEKDQNQDPNLMVLKRQTRTRSNGGVYTRLYKNLFPHCEIQEESIPSFYRRKRYNLVLMLKMAMDVALGLKPDSDRNHFRFKRLDTSGDLCFKMFRKIYNEVANSLKLELDRRVEFEKNNYKGKLLSNLIKEENIRSYYWKSYTFLNEFEKAFKGTWNGDSGVSQVLSRYSYVGSISHLRRLNLQMDKTSKQLSPRRLHTSTWGLMCPIDNPDGKNIGMVKSLSLFARVSIQSYVSDLKKLISAEPNTQLVSTIHPSMWNAVWTKVFINSDLFCVVLKDTSSFHQNLISKRRSGTISKFVSLSWNRTENEYFIYADGGRPCRPVYQEGTKVEMIKTAKSWENIMKHMDFIDPQEAECVRISMEPFHASYLSELHGTMILSSSASINPFPDHNQAPRNMFACQQVKQACSWYNTAFNKRFDKLATLLQCPQRPICQTWMTQHVLAGKGGIAYGENAIVALGIYSGYNQEDSVIFNKSSMNRGMFNVSNYHSYNISEEIVDSASRIGTKIANLALNSAYREIVKRKDGKNYDLLDADGIIMVGSEIDVDTVLVGVVSPEMNKIGQITGYNDISILPERGQHGLIDAVYRFTTSDGLQGVKIRIVDNRSPTIGDKIGSRHGQKGTCGILLDEEDMPTTASGIRPDLIVNPHALPSRMTIGQFVETMGSRIGLELGTLIDGTPFSTQNRVRDIKEILVQLGYHPYSNEFLYNGMNGEMIESEIFMGPTYYQRFKHMVEDKINYRSTGQVTMLTKQPTEGRSNGGGLRIGEMERDGLLSYGVSKFLNESFIERSDGHNFLFQPETGLLDANPDHPTTKLTMPYSMGLFVHEIEAMHMQVKLSS